MALLTSQYPTLVTNTPSVIDLNITKASQWPTAIYFGFVTGSSAAHVAIGLEYINNGTNPATSFPDSPTAVYTLTACPMVGAYYLPAGGTLTLNPNVFADSDDLKIHLYSTGAPQLYVMTER